MRAGELVMAHVPGAANIVDFLTKWVDAAKVESSIAFLTGAHSRALHLGDIELDKLCTATAMVALLASAGDA